MNKTQALARQQALVNQARAESRSLTPEEQAEFDRCQQIIDAAPADSASQGAPEGQRGADPASPDPIQQALAAERQRTADITSLCRQVLCRQVGMDADPFIRDGSDMNAVREAAVNFMIQHKGPVGARFTDHDQQQDFRQAASDAILMRSGFGVSSPTEEAYQMQRLSLRDLAIECLAREGAGTTTELLRIAPPPPSPPSWTTPSARASSSGTSPPPPPSRYGPPRAPSPTSSPPRTTSTCWAAPGSSWKWPRAAS